MKKVFIILALLFSSFGTSIYAQSNLSINDSSLFFTSNDTLAPGSNIYYSGQILNESALTLSSNLGLVAACDSFGTQGFDTSNLTIIASNQFGPVTVAPNSTYTFQDTIGISSQFKSGINTVVIWPVASDMNWHTRDSARFNVFIYDPLTIKNSNIIDHLTLYPNPFSDKIWFLTKGDHFIEEVRIFDALGKAILSDKTRNKLFIETSSLSQGVYFIELIYNNGIKKRIKTMKQ